MPGPTDPTPELDPEQDAVRRLLADARHDGPVPDAVADRLDATLAGLIAERDELVGTPPPAERAAVVDLGARRRRMASIGVLAAAAVVVAGVAVGQVLPSGGDSASDGAGASAGAPADRSDEPEAGADAASPSQLPKSAAPGASDATGPQPEILLDDDLEQSLRDLRVLSSRSVALGDVPAGCLPGAEGPGRRITVIVEGQPGLVVLRPVRSGRQLAEVYVCGEPDPVRTLSLPAG